MEKRKSEVSSAVRDDSIDKQIAWIKTSLLDKDLKKTGLNKNAGFNYFELGDFLPELTKLISIYNCNDLFTIEQAEDGRLWAVLYFYYKNEVRSTRMPFNEYSVPEYTRYDRETKQTRVSKQMQEIQYLGAEMTYYRRYLYMALFNISEVDMVDSLDNSKNVKSIPAAPQPVKPKRSEDDLSQPVNQKQKDFLVQHGYAGGFENMTVGDAIKIVDKMKLKEA